MPVGPVGIRRSSNAELIQDDRSTASQRFIDGGIPNLFKNGNRVSDLRRELWSVLIRCPIGCHPRIRAG